MKKLLTVTLFSGLLTLLRMVSGFVISKVVAIHAGPSGIAMLGQVQSIVAALNGVAAAPVGNGVVRFTAEHREAGFDACAPWWRASLQWLFGMVCLLIPVTMLFSKQLATWTMADPSYAWLLVVVALTLPMAGANTLFASVINGQQLYRRFIGLGIISVVISTALTLVLIYAYGRDGALLSAAISAGVAGVIMGLGVMREPWFRLRFWWGRTDRQHLRQIGGYVAMAVCSASCAALSVILVRNILVSSLGWEQTGHWQAVFKISEIYLGVLTVALSTYYLPRLSGLRDAGDIRKEILHTARVVMPIVSLLALGIYLLRDVAISLLFTQQFAPARDLFAVQLIGDVVKMLSWLFAYPMLSRGATGLFIFSEILFSATFVGLSFVFVNAIGVQGATLAFALNYLAYFIFVVLYLPKHGRQP